MLRVVAVSVQRAQQFFARAGSVRDFVQVMLTYVDRALGATGQDGERNISGCTVRATLPRPRPRRRSFVVGFGQADVTV